ncbi:TonB-dependent receptor [Paraflavitalea soli]|uniref:TonB-dependent receptor n=1 Tax=Paraflavitalea soli TaxID=2315862 RepID=A0A3B7MJ73_9BACT|nr:outer membrane beta-barrel family protein [Paraflavitalea soli]AXY74504.1 TonB-dependent receptor [Paraflavitalea soli]
MYYLIQSALRPFFLLILLWSLLQPLPAFTQARPRAADTTVARMKDDTLKSVTVTGRRLAIERKADRTIITVDGLITNAGGNAWETLEQLPGIQTMNDQISLKGKSGVSVYIDDKPTYLQGDDLASYLKSLPASIIDKIEFMSNPPAQYDAAGNGGIINIRLKKSRIKGFNGNILSENIRGRRTRLSQSLNLNLRTNKLNIYGNASNYNGEGVAQSNSLRTYAPDNNNTLYSLTQNGRATVRNDRIFLKSGIDLYASPRTTWGFSASHMYWKATEYRLFAGRQTYATPAATDSVTDMNNTIRTATRNTSLTLNYQHLYDSAGRQLTADVDYIRYGESYGALNITTLAASDGSVANREARYYQQPFTIDIYSVKADYVLPVRKGIKWSMGYKSSFTRASNTAIYSGTINEVTIPEYSVNNRFNYREDIHAAYVNYTTEWKKLAIQVAGRMEHTSLQGHQQDAAKSRDTVFTRTYFNLFPTVFLSYKPGKKGNHQVTFSYGKRIDRPGYTSLRPFETPLDKYNYRIGNPYLRPELSDNIELAWLFRNNYSASLFYNHLKNGIEETIEVRDNVFYRRPNNVSSKQVMGFSLDGSIRITRDWIINPVIQYTWTLLATQLNNQDLRVRGGNWHLSANTQLSLPKGWTIELAPDYSSREVYVQYVQAPTWYIHSGISKKIWKDNAVIKLNFRDMFYTRQDNQDLSHVKDVSGYSKRTWDTQSITLALSYRFSKGTKGVPSGGGRQAEELKRLGDAQ